MTKKLTLGETFTIAGGSMLGGRAVPPLTFQKVVGSATYRASLKRLEELRSPAPAPPPASAADSVPEAAS